MDFNLPPELSELLTNLDRFIDQEIRPLQAQDDNERFFDHRREWARTDFDNGGLPRPEWEALLLRMQEARGQGRLLPPDRCPRNTAARRSATCGWRSSATTWRARGWACSTTCRTNIRWSATSR